MATVAPYGSWNSPIEPADAQEPGALSARFNIVLG